MESSGCVGIMAVVAVSSSVAFVAHQVHKRLDSDFMKKVALELGNNNVSRSLLFSVSIYLLSGGRINRPKKKVWFAADVKDPSTDNKEYRRRISSRAVE
ncbi:hypothetical protein HPP92_011802 [Vanilla planifolia]|uniref:Uncharacterized protein n=1 Tax=Vanilla planifolia TaxID=51239 RepID=A0A835R4V5_VANPL|nr:hypothetical protein HPP92_011802 [Vanilla planifolia]